MTSPKEEKASFKDFSSIDHDKPARPKSHITIETHQNEIYTTSNGYESRERPPTKSLLFGPVEEEEGGEQKNRQRKFGLWVVVVDGRLARNVNKVLFLIAHFPASD